MMPITSEMDIAERIGFRGEAYLSLVAAQTLWQYRENRNFSGDAECSLFEVQEFLGNILRGSLLNLTSRKGYMLPNETSLTLNEYACRTWQFLSTGVPETWEELRQRINKYKDVLEEVRLTISEEVKSGLQERHEVQGLQEVETFLRAYHSILTQDLDVAYENKRTLASH